MTDDLESRTFRAEEARQFIGNPLFREMFDGVAQLLDQAALSCDPDNKDKAQRIIVSRQLLAALKREMTRKVEDGDVARMQIAELEKRGALRMFRR